MSRAARGAEGFEPVVLDTDRGPVDVRWYWQPGCDCGALYVGGTGGGFDTPARGLYPDLCAELLHSRVGGLRLRFRNPRDLDESVADVLAGLHFLHEEGVSCAAVVGHSFGGAVVARAAALSNRRSTLVSAVVTLATQAQGVEAIGDLAPRCAALIIHGAADTVLPSSCSEYAYQIAHEPKKLAIYPGAGHSLDEVATEVREEICVWIVDHVRPSWGWA